MGHDLKYYNNHNQSIIIPKIFYNFKYRETSFFIFEWIEFISYFRKLESILNFYILKSLIRNYYSNDINTNNNSRMLITKIVYNLNAFIYDQDHVEYFINFDSTIIRFKKLSRIINETDNFECDKKKTFIDFIISTLDILEEIIIIFEDNGIINNNIYFVNTSCTQENTEYNNCLYIEPPDNINLIPFAGGSIKSIDNKDKKIKSFWVSKTCITNYQYLQFIKDGGYLNKNLWSKEGFYWLSYNRVKHPKNWTNTNNKWYINNHLINYTFNYPVQKISYFEAEACAKYYNSKLPSEEEWNWLETNRNKTEYPYGIEIPILFDISTEFTDILSCQDSTSVSLMGLVHLYGNTWEYTTTTKNNENMPTTVCLKGGDWKVPNFILNKNLKMYIEKDSRDYSTGFRIIKN